MKKNLLLTSVIILCLTINSQAQVSFNSNVDFQTGSNPHSGAIEDIDGDGKPDIIISNFNDGTISIFHNTSTSGVISLSSFAPKVDLTVGSFPVGIAIADIDGDSKKDLIVTNRATSGSISIFRNISTSGTINTTSFEPKVDFPVGNYPHYSVVRDFDGDGKSDIATSSYYDNYISVFRNISSPGLINSSSLAPKIDFATDVWPLPLEVADIDGDGKPDMVSGNRGSGTISIYRNTSVNGVIDINSFAPKVDLTATPGVFDLQIADFDGDGKPDLSFNSDGGNPEFILRQNLSIIGSISAGSFSPAVSFSTNNPVGTHATEDIDGDGKVDLIVAYTNTTPGSVSVFRNISTGAISSSSFASEVNFATAAAPYFLFLGDADVDNKLDIIVPCQSSNVVSILRNNNSLTGQIDFQDDDMLSAYPNPTTGNVSVKIEEGQIGSAYSLEDNLGRIVLSGILVSQSNLLEIEALSKGVYLLRIQDSLQGALKIIKQ